MNEVDELLSLIKNSNYLIVFTGAGISTESGIPSFRGKEGLWAKYRPEIYGTFTGLISQFLIKPSNVVNFIFDFTSPILEAKPNISHICLAKLEEKGYLKSIITQNIDNLHSDAGNKNVIELHGNLYIWRCKKCENIEKIGKEKLSEFAKNLKKIQGRRELIRYINNFVKCKCGGRKRPDIVFFGEPLPFEAFEKAKKESKKADLFIIIGSSGIVSPACDLPYIAKENGAKIIEINPEGSCFENITDLIIIKRATEVFEELIKKI